MKGRGLHHSLLHCDDERKGETKKCYFSLVLSPSPTVIITVLTYPLILFHLRHKVNDYLLLACKVLLDIIVSQEKEEEEEEKEEDRLVSSSCLPDPQ